MVLKEVPGNLRSLMQSVSTHLQALSIAMRSLHCFGSFHFSHYANVYMSLFLSKFMIPDNNLACRSALTFPDMIN